LSLLDDTVVGKQEMVSAIDAVCDVAQRIIGKLKDGTAAGARTRQSASSILVHRDAIALAVWSRCLPSSVHGQRSHAIDGTRSVLDGVGSGAIVGV
jgi:hypothetical protein